MTEKNEKWVNYWCEEATWAGIQQEVDVRAKSLASTPTPMTELKAEEGIMAYKSLCKLAPPELDPRDQDQGLYWIYAPLVLRLLKYSCWVCLGLFDYREGGETIRHWVYFVKKAKGTVNRLRSYFSLFASTEYFGFFKNTFILSHPLYEILRESIDAAQTSEKEKWMSNLDKGFPFIINLDKHIEAPGEWINRENLAPYGLVFDLSEVWQKILKCPDMDRTDAIKALEASLPMVTDEAEELLSFISDNDIASNAYKKYADSADRFVFPEDKRIDYLKEMLKEKANNPTGDVHKREIISKSHFLLKKLLDEDSDLSNKFLNYLLLMADVTSGYKNDRGGIGLKKSNASSILTLPAWLPYGSTGKASALITCFERNLKRSFQFEDINKLVSAFRLGSLNFALEKAKEKGREAELEMEVNKERSIAHISKSLHSRLNAYLKEKDPRTKIIVRIIAKFFSYSYLWRQYFDYDVSKLKKDDYFYIDFFDFWESLIVQLLCVYYPFTKDRIDKHELEEINNYYEEYFMAFEVTSPEVRASDYHKLIYPEEKRKKFLENLRFLRLDYEKGLELPVKINVTKSKIFFFPLLVTFTEFITNTILHAGSKDTVIFLKFSKAPGKKKSYYISFSNYKVEEHSDSFLDKFESIETFLKGKKSFGLRSIEIYLKSQGCEFTVSKPGDEGDQNKFSALIEVGPSSSLFHFENGGNFDAKI